MEYAEFLQSKAKKEQGKGLQVDESKLNKNLFPFQLAIVIRALMQGCFAIFADCGLGKSLMQLAWADYISKETGKPVLILAPLAVVGQTIEEGKKFGVQISEYGEGENIQITNYEQLEKIDASDFVAVVLDESSILKNFTGKYRNLIIDKFTETPYKLACTATPSPNDELEIGNHAEFLNYMSSVDMRAMYFVTDKSIKDGEKYRLKKHAVKEFYKWIATWSVFISSPADLGFDDEGYNLPPLKFIEKQIKTDSRDNGQLFNDVAVSATNFNQELRLTINKRFNEVAKIVNESTEPFIVWVKLNTEADLALNLIPDAVQVSGSEDKETKKSKLLGFAKGDFRVLVTKAKMASFGLNYQHCNNQVFASLDFSFESLYQAIRRSHRFGQKKQVNIHLITTDTMQNVINSINEKEEKFTKMKNGIINIMNQKEEETPKQMEIEVVESDHYKVMRGDCIELIKTLPDDSQDYTFFSPPFGALYVFSNDPADLSNVKNDDEFMQHFRFLVSELMRVTKPGRLVSMHLMQGTTLLGRDGFYSIKDLRGDMIRLFQEHGFYFHEEHMIRKDPKTAAIRTKNRQLMHGQTKKDSTISRPGLADYIVSFKKPGINEVPVVNDIPFDLWCVMAEPVWTCIDESDTLKYRGAKGEKDERHLTPTQLKPIEWCYLMYSNKGDQILCPFMGIGSEGFQAIKMGRKYTGFELKKSYFDHAVKNLQAAIAGNQQISIFDLLQKEEVA